MQARVSHAPPDAGQLADRAGALNTEGRFEDAMEVAAAALALDAALPGAWCNLGNALAELQRHDDAIACYANALRIAPAHAASLANLGVVLLARGAPDRAIGFLELACSVTPDHAETRCNLGLALMAAGHWSRGFAEYEWRWATAAMTAHGMPADRRWHGESAPGATLLVHEEGGFGDAIQFVRFAREARSRVGRVILRVRAPLAGLLARADGVDLVVTDRDPWPAFDLHCPILSLAHETGADPCRPGFGAPYLASDPTLDRAWRKRLGPADPAVLRVGLVWAGSPRHGMAGAARADRRRSLDQALLSPLLDRAGGRARFYSLQVGAPEVAARDPRIVDLTSELRSFDDTASLIACLDLVIAVDTSTAHLAAAMGCETWMLSRFDQCWRWMAGRRDSPWYASLILFQQTAPGDWSGPIDEVAAALDARLDRGGRDQLGASSPSVA